METFECMDICKDASTDKRTRCLYKCAAALENDAAFGNIKRSIASQTMEEKGPTDDFNAVILVVGIVAIGLLFLLGARGRKGKMPGF